MSGEGSKGAESEALGLEGNSERRRGLKFFKLKPKRQNDSDAQENIGVVAERCDEKHTVDNAEGAEETEKEKSPPPVGFLELFRYSTRFQLFMNAIGLVCAAAAGAAQPVMTIIFGSLTNNFVDFGSALSNFEDGTGTSEQVDEAASKFRHGASLNASYLVYIGLGTLVCTYIFMYTWVNTGEATSRRVRENYLKATLRQDVAFFDNVGAGEIATRIQTDTHLVQQGISEKVALLVMYSSSFFAGFIVAYIRSWRLALALSSILPCVSIAGGVMNVFVIKYTQQSGDAISGAGTIAEEVISTIRTAQAFGTQKVLSSLYDGHIEKAHKVDLKMGLASGFGLAFFFFVIYSAYGLAFSFGTTLIIQGHADAGIVIGVFTAVLIGSFSLAVVAPDIQAIANARGAAAKLYQTIDRVPDIDSANEGGLQPHSVKGEIKLESVVFNYPSRPKVSIVRDLSITFPAGKTAALVGASGSGKSTIVALVERFYDPLSGRVTLDGSSLKDLNLKWLRGQIGYVSQEPVLFATTIKGNVAHGLIGTPWEHASEEKRFELIREACIRANADGFISKLPSEYDTLVGERGFLLSGGQKQRVAIARAIVSDPRILLLDEATSALDTQSEGIVQDALDKATAGRTTIVIAHRLSTIKNANCIYVMGNGAVLEHGTHDELLANSESAYTRLVAAQRLREQKENLDVVDASVSLPDVELARQHQTNVKGDILRELEEDAIEKAPLGRKNTSQSLTSEILEQRAKETENPARPREYSLTYLFMRMGKLQSNAWKSYLFGAIFALLTGLVYPAFGIVYSMSITTFEIRDDNARLRREGDRNALWFFVIALLSMMTIGIQNYMFLTAAADLSFKLRSLVFKAMLRQDIEFFDKDGHGTGSLTASLSDNPQKVNGLAGITLATIVQSFSTIVGGIIIGLIYQWKLALVAIATGPLLVISGYIQLRIYVVNDEQNKAAHEQSAQIACEAAGAIRTVASLTREDDCLDIYSKSLEEPMRRSQRMSIYSHFIYAFSQSMIFFVIALVFWYGADQVSRGNFGTTAFFVCLFSVTFSAVQAGSGLSFVPDISRAKGAASDMIRLLDKRPQIDAESTEGNVISSKEVRGQVIFEGVHFRYPTRPDARVLKNLSLKVEPGTYIALVGASGCGKSTIIQLFERFYDPTAGNIHLDGQNISELNIQEYRKHIALVSQEPTLYSGSIKFNILLGATKPHEEVTQGEIEQACRDANILEFVQSLPDGFDTAVGSKGSQLSGGQKQRIAIARALLRNPKVLLLDEATSALDSNSEKVVQDALDVAARGRTTIAIAHRLSTIQNADCIYFINDGRVSESGTHDQLLDLRGDYYEYVQLQALSKR